MNIPISYTTEEISKMLKISKLTVYDLIKKGELPSFRVGKQMRIDAEDLEAYKQRSRGPQPSQHVHAGIASARPMVSPSTPVVITGQDISLDMLAKHLEHSTSGLRPLRSYAGSLDSLISMYRGEADIVSTHLWDGDTGDYNIPYIRKILVGFSYVVINLVSRWAGFYVAPGNPLHLTKWEDLAKPGLRLANREKGSGARVLLDEQLRLLGIDKKTLVGYDHEQSHHLGVAGKVSAGDADVGIGIEKAALIVGQLEFIPLIQERYDLVILKDKHRPETEQAVTHLLNSDTFKHELQAIHGYDLSLTGQIMYET